MFSALFSGTKNASLNNTSSKSGVSRPSFSSRRGKSGSPTEVAGTRHPANVNVPTRSDARTGASFGGKSRTQDKNSQALIDGKEHKSSLGQAASDNIEPRLRTRPSSPLLGERYRRTSLASGSGVDSKPHTAQTGGSNSSFDSPYDAQNSPLSISQQTSASAVRDFNTKRGHGPMASSGRKQQIDTRGGYQVDNQSLQSSKSGKSRNSTLRPRHIDLSSLFPKPAVTKGPPLSPRRYRQSPSPFSGASTDPSPLQTYGSSRAKNTSKSGKLNRQYSQTTGRPPHPLSKPIVPMIPTQQRKPRIENWFDGPEGNVSDDEELFLETGVKETSSAQQANKISSNSRADDYSSLGSLPPWTSQGARTELAPPQMSTRRSSKSSSTRLPSDANSFRFPAQPTTPQNPNYRRQVAMSMSSKRSKASTFDQANLMKESVLSMSSSDDESDLDGSMSPRSHNSILSSYVQGLSAQAARFKLDEAATEIERARTPVSHQHSRLISEDRTTMSSRSGSPAFLDHRFQSTQVVKGGNKDISKQEHATTTSYQQGRYTPSAWKPVGTRMNSVRSNASSSRASTLTVEPTLPRKHSDKSSVRTMTVTREEEALLEAIRQKKGFMRGSKSSDSATQNQSTPYHHDIVYTADPRRKGIKALEPSKGGVAGKGFDKNVGQSAPISKTAGNHPLKTTLYLSSSEASSPDQAHFAQSYRSSIEPSVLGPSPTAESRDSPSPVTPPRSTLNEELPPLRISSLRPIDPALQQVAGNGPGRLLNGGLLKFNNVETEDSNHLLDLSEWAIPTLGTGQSSIAVMT